MQSQARVLIKRPPQWLSAAKGPTVDLYYWYHGARALRLGGGNAWLPWRAALRDALLANQQRDGNARGSWDPVDVWGADGGRVYATALATMALLAAFQPR